MTFREVGDAEAASSWDGWLSSFDARGIRQTFAWGEHKRGGWTPARFAAFDGETPVAMAQALTRRAPLGAATLAWVNAGPVFRDEAALRAFLDGLKNRFLEVPRAVVRIAPRVADSPALREALSAARFTPARSALDSGRTVVVDLGRPLDELRAGLDRKWRNQLKKAESASPVFERGSDPALLSRFLALHEQTRGRKKLKDGVTFASLEKAARDFGPALTFCVVSAGGADGAALSWWTFEGRATLWLSSSSAAGMAACLPNAAYWHAFETLKADGAVSFDLSGIDAKENPGVTHFKMGTGGRELVTPGEWDWSASALPKSAFNSLLSLVRGRLPR